MPLSRLQRERFRAAVARRGRGRGSRVRRPRCLPKNKALLRRAWDEVYGQGRPDSVEESVLDDVIAHEPDRELRGIEEFKRYLATYLAAFPDTGVTIEDVIAEGDKVVSRYTVRGTHTGTTEDYGPPTGRQIVTEGITIYHFSGGKIA